MGQPVFISYARKSSREHAEALHRALGGEEGLAFLDSSGLEPGERFPPALAEALLGSRVVVLFASEDYFQANTLRQQGVHKRASDLEQEVKRLRQHQA